jgi:hypothetical protein
MWNCPYANDSFPVYAEDIDGDASPSTALLSSLARELAVVLVGGSIPERVDDKLFNTCCVFDTRGLLLARHRKVCWACRLTSLRLSLRSRSLSSSVAHHAVDAEAVCAVPPDGGWRARRAHGEVGEWVLDLELVEPLSAVWYHAFSLLVFVSDWHQKRGGLIWAQTHLFDINIPGKISFQESATLTAGDAGTVVDTEVGRLGIGICFDVRFPDLAAIYAARGAHMLIFPGAILPHTLCELSGQEHRVLVQSP